MFVTSRLSTRVLLDVVNALEPLNSLRMAQIP